IYGEEVQRGQLALIFKLDTTLAKFEDLRTGWITGRVYACLFQASSLNETSAYLVFTDPEFNYKVEEVSDEATFKDTVRGKVKFVHHLRDDKGDPIESTDQSYSTRTVDIY
ncbi:13113_t:CDS:2, partial [Funneliformis caledonium]